MRSNTRRFAVRFLISALVAVATPAAAAGLVAGVSAAADTLAEATPTMLPPLSAQDSAVSAAQDQRIATAGPRRLSVLVHDNAAWTQTKDIGTIASR